MSRNSKGIFNAKLLPYVPTYEEILSKIRGRYKKLRPRSRGWRGRKRLELERIELVYNVLKSEIDRLVDTAIDVGKLHPFYGDLVKLLINYDEYERCIHEFKKVRRLLIQFYNKYHSLIKSKTPDIKRVKERGDRGPIIKFYAEIKRLRREAIGRMLSLLKRRRKCLEVLKESYKALRNLPSIDAELPSIIVAGMPQVGKSTLVSKISSAKPEIAPYPFTTKSIIIGHIRVSKPYETLIQVIDTPGLLDRPLSERNKIELQAILALRHLKGVIVYLIDTSINRYYSFEEQVNVLREIIETFRDKEILVALNKIDKSTQKEVNDILKRVLDLGIPRDRIFLISALHGYNVDILLNTILSRLLHS